jgi:hypothetical protein
MCALLAKATEPYWAGFGLAGGGFVCCALPEEELPPPVANAALVSIIGGHLSASQLEEGFKDLVDEDWNWQVQKPNNSDFLIVVGIWRQ